ncbi:hypothetical protein HanRHA438_Chr14g0652351 [Helianthus annuus]|nr:hypothetical protein HanRHA438_Chr14g0652351 [Helianthus annuus]
MSAEGSHDNSHHTPPGNLRNVAIWVHSWCNSALAHNGNPSLNSSILDNLVVV